MADQQRKAGFMERLFSRVKDSAVMGTMLDALEADTTKLGHATITDIHVLRHLLLDAGVRDALGKSGGDVVALARTVASFLERTSGVYRTPKPVKPRPTQFVMQVMEQAELRCSVSPNVPYPVQVLLGLMVAPCPASSFTADQGVTAMRVMQTLAHADLGENCGVTLPELNVPEAERVAEVWMLNDDFTSMEFVVHVLENLLGMGKADAERTMLRIHNEGKAPLGPQFLVDAIHRAELVHEYARRHGMPLRCAVGKPA